MQTTDALLFGILLLLFGGIAILGDVLLPFEWAVGTLWLGLFVGVGGVQSVRADGVVVGVIAGLSARLPESQSSSDG